MSADQVAVLALHPHLARRSRAAATAVKNRASLGALAPSCCALNGSIMLDEASISRPMRRPGNDTSCWVSEVNGSASARMKNGRPARNSSSGAWRTNENGDWPDDRQNRRQRHADAGPGGGR